MASWKTKPVSRELHTDWYCKKFQLTMVRMTTQTMSSSLASVSGFLCSVIEMTANLSKCRHHLQLPQVVNRKFLHPYALSYHRLPCFKLFLINPKLNKVLTKFCNRKLAVLQPPLGLKQNHFSWFWQELDKVLMPISMLSNFHFKRLTSRKR